MLNNPIIGGTSFPTLTNPGTAGDLADGKQLIGQNGNIVTGTLMIPGITWKTGSGAQIPTPYLSSMAYGGGKFVLFSSYSNPQNVAFYSTDGITWHSTPIPEGIECTSVTYGSGKFVAACGNTFLHSIDGINWTQTSWPISGQLVCAYGNGKFVAASTAPYPTAAYSTDGTTWTKTTFPLSSAFTLSITYGIGKFVAIVGNTTTGAYSTDGITWETMTMPSGANWSALSYGGGTFVATATNGGGKIARSTNGINWSESPNGAGAGAQTLTYGSGKFICAGSTANTAYYSTDGITWRMIFLPDNGAWMCSAYGKGRFVIGGGVNNSYKTIYSG